MEEVNLSTQLRKIFLFNSSELREFIFLSRLAGLKLAHDLKIPAPGKTLLNQFIETFPGLQDEKQQFDGQLYNNFLDDIAKDPERQGLFEHTAMNDFKLATIDKLLYQGYCMDLEAKLALQKEKTKYSFSVATFSGHDFPKVETYTEDELAQYFEGHRETYKIGAQIMLECLEFSEDAFRDQLSPPMPMELNRFYRSHPAQFAHLEENSAMLQQELQRAYEKNELQKMAMNAADQFVYQLYEKNIGYHSPEFGELLRAQNLNPKELSAITLGQFFDNEHFSGEPLEQASKLNSERYYSDPVLSKTNTVCILLYKDTIPAIYPPLESVRERVVSDFLKHRTAENFDTKIRAVHDQLLADNAMELEQFIKITQENGATLETSENVEFNASKGNAISNAVQSLKVGHISKVIATNESEKAILFLAARDVPTEFDGDELARKMAALESVERNVLQDYIVELIANEMEIKGDARALLLKQFQSIAPLYYMQLRHSTFDL
jgi:hypothetical protein